MIKVYTDGSYDKATHQASWAWAAFQDNQLLDSAKGICRVGHDLRNVAGECEAALRAVQWAVGNEYEVVVVHDYEGVAKWPQGDWNAKSDYTKNYTQSMQSLLRTALISFEWVKGHSGNDGNEYVDKLAKSAFDSVHAGLAVVEDTEAAFNWDNYRAGPADRAFESEIQPPEGGWVDAVIDLESDYCERSGLSVSAKTGTSAQEYFSRTHIHTIGVELSTGEEWVGHPKDFEKTELWARLFHPTDYDPRIRKWAANANFDDVGCRSLWGPPATPWHDILDFASFHQLPRSVEGLCNALLGMAPDKSTRDNMNGVVFVQASDEFKQEIRDYCSDDVHYEMMVLQVMLSLGEMTDLETCMAMHTRWCCRRGLTWDMPLTDQHIGRLKKVREIYQRVPEGVAEDSLEGRDQMLMPWVGWGHWRLTTPRKTGVPEPNYYKGTPGSKDAFLEWLDVEGVERPPHDAFKTDDDTKSSLDKKVTVDWERENPRGAELLDNKRTHGKLNKIVKNLQTVKRMSVGDIFFPSIIYCTAPHTRRWGSRTYNIQNPPRDAWFKDLLGDEYPDEVGLVMKPSLLECGRYDRDENGVLRYSKPITLKDGTPILEHPGVNMRALYRAAPDHELVIMDYSQVEPRVLAWLCGDTKFLELVAEGVDVYEAFGRVAGLWNHPIGYTMAEHDPELRRYCKAAVLGLGYGCGAKMYVVVALTMAGLTLTDKEASKAVQDYRRKNPLVPQFWNELDRELLNAAKSDPNTWVHEMPSGETIKLFDIKVKKGRGGFTGTSRLGDRTDQSFKKNLWGGLATENVVQRGARDLMAYHVRIMLRDEFKRHGIEILSTAHDEIIAQCKIGQGDEVKEYMEKVMTTPPPFMPGLPLGAEGGLLMEYGKV